MSIVIATDFKTIVCCGCHCVFAVPEDVYLSLKETRNTFHCVSCGQRQHFTGENYSEGCKRLEARCRVLGEIIEAHERRVPGFKGAMGLLRKQRDEARAKATEKGGE